MELRLLSVNVGMPRELGIYGQGEHVISGIAKAPVDAASIFVGRTNLAGDGQADLSVHGGVDKAVYCYPKEHWAWWEGEKRLASRAGTFGENLTVEGADETQVAIGDRFRWGDAMLEVSQPRAPCYKFAMHTKRPDAPALMTRSGRSGWYFRVIREGAAPVHGGVLVRDAPGGGPTVRDAFFAALDPRADAQIRARVASTPALAASWRTAVERRMWA
jgi:MOSC domain-containing protein YiiM